MIKLETHIEKPKPLKSIPIALVLLVFCSFDIMMAEPTTHAIAAPKPANRRNSNQIVLFWVKASGSYVITHKDKPMRKNFTLA